MSSTKPAFPQGFFAFLSFVSVAGHAGRGEPALRALFEQLGLEEGNFNGRGERIRTSDLSVPNRAHYQAVLRPER